MRGYFLKPLCALLADPRGVTALEYAVVAGLTVTVLGVAFTIFFNDLQTALSNIDAAIPT